MEEFIDDLEDMILSIRFSGNDLETAGEMLESPRELVRKREAVAMRKLRRAGYSDAEIREFFTGRGGRG